jgi:uncharacterized protein (TIGR03067 family)
MRALMLMSALAFAAPIRQDTNPMPEHWPSTQILGNWRDRTNPSHVLAIRPGQTDFIVDGQFSPADGLTAKVVIDWSTNPVAIDFMPRDRGGQMLGILKLEGNQLQIAINTEGSPRPNDFGIGDIVLRYHRTVK